jgi:hypothetical protein
MKNKIQDYNRDNWIQDRQDGYIRYELAWFLFEEDESENKPNLTKEEFYKHFDVWIKSGLADLSKFFQHYDALFEVEFLLNKQGQVILIQ